MPTQTTRPSTLQHITSVYYDGFVGYIWSFYPGVCPHSNNSSSYNLPEEFIGNSIKTNHPETRASLDGPVEPVDVLHSVVVRACLTRILLAAVPHKDFVDKECIHERTPSHSKIT
jgi:hypothetical protein